MRKNKFIETVLKDLKQTSKYLTEAYIFNDEEDYSDAPEMEETPYMGDESHHIEKGPQMANKEGESKEEEEMHAHEVIQHEPIIGKIRETAIEGLKKYADHPTSSLYEFFKKVFLESDKVLTNTGNK